MTHFTVGIIVPNDKLTNLASFLDEQMRPYDENITVPPYVSYSIEEARSEIERDIARLERIIARNDADYNLDKCREILTELLCTTPENHYRDYVERAGHRNAKGEPLSTYNPASKWDWWVIGGRWSGWITGNKNARSESVKDNMAPIEQAIERNILPHAIITPDGQWHERGQMGWWAILLTENENWDAEAKEILASYPGHQLVIVDAHI